MTFSDFAVMAIAPTLIVLLLSSLVYFVILCVYRGGYPLRLGYIWFMFILGAVNLARLSIEESRKYAFGYAAALGIATFFVLGRLGTVSGPAAALAPLVNGLLIAIVWFLADRITYDCTLIDDDEDPGDQGFLDGLTWPSSARDASNSLTPGTEETTADQESAAEAKPNRRKRRRVRQPGRTVLWLSAAALPLFGLGQATLHDQPAALASSVRALGVYLFAALSLLVATSFLGIRSYLRRRGVAMPREVSVAWLGGGIALVAALLLLSFLLPQPGRMLADLPAPQWLQSPDGLDPSRFGWGSETAEGSDPGNAATATPQTEDRSEAGSGDAASDASDGSPSGQPGGQAEGQAGQPQDGSSGPPRDGQPSDPAGGADSSPADGQPEGRPSDPQAGQPDGQSAGQPSEPAQATEPANGSSPTPSDDAPQPAGESSPPSSAEQPSDSSAEPRSDANREASEGRSRDPESTTSEASQPSPSQPPASPPSFDLNALLGWFKALVYLILFGILAAFCWINRAAFGEWWRRLQAWLAGQQTPAVAAALQDETLEPVEPPKPFAAYRNPLATGATPRRAVIETFQATEAWYREQGQPRGRDETPQEYIRRLPIQTPQDRQVIEQLILAYNRIVYGGMPASRQDLGPVQQVWDSVFRRTRSS